MCLSFDYVISISVLCNFVFVISLDAYLLQLYVETALISYQQTLVSLVIVQHVLYLLIEYVLILLLLRGNSLFCTVSYNAEEAVCLAVRL
jgi:hypothetical protein